MYHGNDYQSTSMDNGLLYGPIYENGSIYYPYSSLFLFWVCLWAPSWAWPSLILALIVYCLIAHWCWEYHWRILTIKVYHRIFIEPAFESKWVLLSLLHCLFESILFNLFLLPSHYFFYYKSLYIWGFQIFWYHCLSVFKLRW